MRYCIIFLLLFTCLSLSSCFVIGKVQAKTIAKREFTEKHNAIPPEFKDDENVFLFILIGNRKYDKCLKKHVTENYTGKHRFLSLKELNSAKYSNKEIYKYYFYFSFSNGGGKQYFVKDRLNDVIYQNGTHLVNYCIALDQYVQNLENKRSNKRSNK